MARPAFVIGLGGTGQWVLTYLKSELMELNGGVMPSEVQLLGFDTQSPDVNMLGAGGAANGDARMGQVTDAQVGNIRLDKNNEFIKIGCQLYDVIRKIRNATPPRPEFEWLDTAYLQNLGAAVCDTNHGAGAYRQLGRLSLFNQVEAVYHRLYQGMQRGQEETKKWGLGDGGGQQYSLSVIVVTSLAGGTGAGIFIDIAWLLRTAARSLNFFNYNLSAFIVMPTAWEQAGQSTDKRLRSYAAWKELDRFMLNPVNTQDPPKIVYLPNATPPLEAVCDTRIFDNTYLVDPARSVNSLALRRPEDSTYPVTAQVIASLLDNHIGEVMAKDMSNVAAHIGQIPYDVYHHSAGAFTFKTPHNFIKQQCFNEYSTAVLERFLEPNYGPSGEAIGIREDRNQEAQPATTPHGASAFLLADKHGNLQNNALLPHIEMVSGKGSELNKYAVEEALKVVDRRGATFQALTTKVIDPKLSTELNTLVNERIWQVVPPSGDRPNATPNEIKQDVVKAVEAKDEEWFGKPEYVVIPIAPPTKFLTRVTEGSKVQVLRKTASDLADNYKALLKEWTSRQLNGLNADPSIAKGGKLGYVIGVYEQLDAKFNKYLTYLENVKEQIAEEQTRAKRTAGRNNARKIYNLMAGKECSFAFFDRNVHPKAREAERDYLRISDKLFEYYLSEFVLFSLEEAVRAMQKFTKASKENLTGWVRLLATGKHDGDPEKHYNGLYDFAWTIVRRGVNGLQSEINMGNPNFEANQELAGVQQMLNVQA
ncbi:MAG: tubulin-like doman-containing protein, partial [Anaerolineaceae bacterium]|nr:tubulin-like doman-containing protein [Anaerolineaceae bacterium]